MDNDRPDTADIRRRLLHACEEVDLMYVPGHQDIPGNELADTHAKAAAGLEQPYANEAISLTTARSIIKAEINDTPTTHRIGKQFYHLVSQQRDHLETKSRKQGAVLSQLRSNHHKSLNYYKNFIDKEITDQCQRCESNEIDDVEHWLTRCPQTAAARQRIFGSHKVNMMELGTSPAKIIQLTEKKLDLQ